MLRASHAGEGEGQARLEAVALDSSETVARAMFDRDRASFISMRDGGDPIGVGLAD